MIKCDSLSCNRACLNQNIYKQFSIHYIQIFKYIKIYHLGEYCYLLYLDEKTSSHFNNFRKRTSSLDMLCCKYVCVCACVRVCVRACVRACAYPEKRAVQLLHNPNMMSQLSIMLRMYILYKDEMFCRSFCLCYRIHNIIYRRTREHFCVYCYPKSPLFFSLI